MAKATKVDSQELVKIAKNKTSFMQNLVTSAGVYVRILEGAYTESKAKVIKDMLEDAKTIQTKLKQIATTAEAQEKATITYLKKLDAVANGEV